RYFPALDGLRAVAVLAVLLYHGDASWIPGGFLGVEVFFVISGFLITRMLVTPDGDRGIDLAGFWVRRARRLLPAVMVVLAAVSLYSSVFVASELSGLRDDVLGALAYATNWVLIFHQESYFEAIGRPSLLQHLWSLAVEEQFYLLWPLVVWVCLRLGGRRTVGAVALAGAAASTVAMWLLFDPDADPSRVYYGTDTRAAGLLLGAVFAIAASQGRITRAPAWLATAAGLAGALVLAWSFATRGEYEAGLYRGGFLLVDVATVGLIFAALHGRERLLRPALATSAMRWVGLRSYSLYLWHWPVFMLTRPHADVPFDGLPLWALRFGLSFALAEASYRWVETPVRKGGLARWWRSLRAAGRPVLLRPGLAAALLVATAGGTTAGVLAAADPPRPPDHLATESVRLVFHAQPQPAETAATPTTEPMPPPATAETATPQASDDSPAAGNVSQGAAEGITAKPTPEATAVAEPTPDAAPAPITATTTVTATPAEPTPTPAPPPPPPPPPPRAGVRVTAIGDSVMLGAAWALGSALGDVEVDAAVSRQGPDGVALVEALAASGGLGNIVVVHLGTNGSFTGGQLDAIMSAAGHRVVVFVNLRVPRSWEDAVNGVIAAGVRRHANARLADWNALSSGHPEWFRDDGVHLEPDGQAAYAALIAGIVNG
ncbi:MAG: acyltransferase family protein, partial [Dehalococcoidia bacterium]